MRGRSVDGGATLTGYGLEMGGPAAETNDGEVRLAMKHSTERILTTHCGSLPRPHHLLDLMKARRTRAA